MFLLEILAALALLQLWSGHNPLHRDEWFAWWLDRFDAWPWLKARGYLHGALVLFVPTVLVAAMVTLLPSFLAFMLSALVLVYCLGRGEFGGEVQPYTNACSEGDWERAERAAARQGVDTSQIVPGHWTQMHEKMLEAAAYQGFERMFAVLFWFVFLGPLGAILYRLSFAYRNAQKTELANHWLWALEWLPARILGASFAVTGNFVGCINRWRKHLFCPKSGAGWVLTQAVLGALSVDDELMQSCDVTQREVAAVKRLYVRTLWFWLAVLALWVLFGPIKILP